MGQHDAGRHSPDRRTRAQVRTENAGQPLYGRNREEELRHRRREIEDAPYRSETETRRPGKRRKKKNNLLKGLGVTALVLLVILAAVVGAYFLWEKAPEVGVSKPVSTPMPTAAPVLTTEPQTTELPDEPEPTPTPEPEEEMDNGLPPETERQDGVYTLLVAGNDDGTGNTDTMMVCRLDTNKHEINVVTIPRDTVLNVDWEVRKLNSVYWGAESGNGEGIWALKMHIRRFIGFEVDNYAVVDLDVFTDFVDTLGGVWFDVPMLIEYEDWMGDHFDEWTNIEPGYQLLNGYQCMAICRHRQSYIEGDLGRIEMQHDFLRFAASQFISLGKLPNAAKALGILNDRLTTDLSAANIAFFVRQALLCKPENIHFYTMPTTPKLLQGYSYAVPTMEGWIDMINVTLNPYETEIGYGNLNIVYVDAEDRYHGTAGIDGEWYFE